MTRAWAALLSGRAPEADSLFRTVLEQQPRHRGAFMGRVHAARARQDHAGALALIEPWFAQDRREGQPHFSRMVLNYMELCILTGAPDKARAAVEDLRLETAILNDRELLRMAATAEKLGLSDVVLQVLARVGAMERISAQSALRLLQMADGTGDTALVGQLRRALVRRVPEDARAPLLVAIERQANGPLAALEELRRLGPPRRDAAAAVTLAEALLDAGAPRPALRYLRLCTRRWPDAPRFRRPLVRACIATGQPEAARAAIDGWADDDPWAATEARVDLASALGDLPAIEAGLDRMEPRRRIPQLRLQLCFARGDLPGAERLVPEVGAAMGRGRQVMAHFGATHVGSVLNELRLWRRFGGARDEGRDEGARAYYFAAREILEAQGERLDRLAAGPVRGARPIPASPISASPISARPISARPISDCPIPAQVFQYWDTRDVPPQIDRIMQGWRGLPGLPHVLFDRPAALAFLRDRFGTDHVRAFRLANHAAEGADFLRLCLLLDRGGIYVDADDRRSAPVARVIDELTGHGRGMVLYRESFGAIANNLLAARPGHPVLAIAVEFARASLLARENDGPWSKTGPGLMTRALACFLADAADDTVRQELLIRPEIDMRRIVAPHVRLPYKTTPKYWDTRFGAIDRTVAQALRAAFVPPDQEAGPGTCPPQGIETSVRSGA